MAESDASNRPKLDGESVRHYVEHYDTKGVYLRSTFPNAETALAKATEYAANFRSVKFPLKGHGVRAITERIALIVLKDFEPDADD